MLAIKILLNLLAVFGLLISLGEMLGRFRDSDRLNFLGVIERELECPKEHPGARKFINDFVLADTKYAGIDLNEVAKIVFVGQWLGNKNGLKNRNVDSVIAGTLKLKSFNGQVTTALCSYEDLKAWSRQSPFWRWLGWGIVAASVLLGVALLVVEELAERGPGG